MRFIISGGSLLRCDIPKLSLRSVLFDEVLVQNELGLILIWIVPKVRPIELFTIVGDDCVPEVELADDVFPYEVLDFGCRDRSKGFGFDPPCKVVHYDDCKYELSLTLWHWAIRSNPHCANGQGLTIGVRGSASCFGIEPKRWQEPHCCTSLTAFEWRVGQ
ncbi:hypothetical protein L3X38_016981 [Prunus dulcis]|uniref:Uncharacterized protein n=1 Tax=Prunus dulcis TaxID=3755 RepID=A0AAD4W6A5_PRUDU|nr:hypothetical protein L3X38_016981 [Prunus dulcis]